MVALEEQLLPRQAVKKGEILLGFLQLQRPGMTTVSSSDTMARQFFSSLAT